MESIFFEKKGTKLILCYTPDNGVDWLFEKIVEEKQEHHIKNTFFVKECNLYRNDEQEHDTEEVIRFCIGEIGADYVALDSDILSVSNHFYFSNDIVLKPKMFVAYRNISILKKIDNIINNDLYIGGKWEEKNGISIEAFNYLLKIFPNSIELNKYANNRIGNILKEWFPEADMYEPIFNKYIVGKSTKKIGSNYSEANMKIELEQFSIALRQLEKMLSEAQGFDERVWQDKIHQILQLLYPKYIFSTREIEFKGIDGYDKRPDFLLVDHGGFVDILEIKKPDAQILTKQASYRNNYVPVREFAGAIQQIEKYIFCLTARKENREYVISKLKEKIPIDITPEIVNPQGILLLGRSNEFNLEQKRDFELIKRQYKNIADIMTYDDLIQRLKNIITSFKMKL